VLIGDAVLVIVPTLDEIFNVAPSDPDRAHARGVIARSSPERTRCQIERSDTDSIAAASRILSRTGSVCDRLVVRSIAQLLGLTCALDYGLSISSDVYREKELTGFGLVLVRDDSSGFSWEWFDRDQGDVFRKLRGGGKVRVTVVNSEQFQELVAVEFLDDITLRCTDDQTGTTHEVRVRKGSVFRVAP
jgi:hypothetical protein